MLASHGTAGMICRTMGMTMTLQENASRSSADIVPARKLEAMTAGLFSAQGSDFVTGAVDALELSFEGIPGDFHAGTTRRSGGREPWYPRGTEMRNERQVSILSPDELRAIAAELRLEKVRPEWMGGNILIEGVPNLSMLPPRTLLFFEGGVTLKVDGQNRPCKLTGRSIAERSGAADVGAMALEFVRVAKRLRGLVAWVEKPGTVRAGERVTARLPEQWIYRA